MAGGMISRLLVAAAIVATFSSVATADQGWNSRQIADWYRLSQGSRLAPESWLKALQAPGGGTFASRAALERYGFLFSVEYGAHGEEFPIGFVRDRDETGRDWIGLNCAACHTSTFAANDARVFVHGGQATHDLQAFVADLVAAVRSTADDQAAFGRFAAATGAGDGPAASALRADLVRWLALRERVGETTSMEWSRWGRGRADAVGVILATTAAIVDPAGRAPLPESNAPVSYPHAWNANQQARLQHNGIVDNGYDFGYVDVAKLGALIRNWTEALGVYADIRMDENGAISHSSIRIDNLLKIEQALARLASPRWPEAFGALDRQRRDRGRVLFEENCAACHGDLDPDDTSTPLVLKTCREASESAPFLPVCADGDKRAGRHFIVLQPVVDDTLTSAARAAGTSPGSRLAGTDPSMACNALLHVSPTGRLKGLANQKSVSPNESDKPFGERAFTTDLLRVVLQRDVEARRMELVGAFAGNQAGALGRLILSWVYAAEAEDYAGAGIDPADPLGPIAERRARCADALALLRLADPDTPVPSYKARPLNGVWATPPYLHNGSVPTLYDLLLPAAERPRRFARPDGAYDPVKAGLAPDPDAVDQHETHRDGVAVPGDWNGGHEYATDLGEDQRRDLVEYLKGL